MMNRNILFFYFLFLCLLNIGCSSSDDGLSAPTITVGKEVVDFENGAGVQEVSVKTNITGWSATADKSWCHPTPSGNFLRISVDESNDRLVREAIITLTFDKQTKTIKVRQLGYEPAILIDQQIFLLNASGGNIKFTVTANVKVGIEGVPEWVKPTSRTRAPEMVSTDYSYTVGASTNEQSREASIEITEILDAGVNDIAPKKALIAITQKGLGNYEAEPGDEIKDDIKIRVVSGTASSFQQGQNIEKSFDGDYTSLYHSNWDNKPENYFPIHLVYNFEELSTVDYLVYHPRSDGNPNGRFKEVDIEYSEDGSFFKPLMSKVLQNVAHATKMEFPKSVQAKSFRFTVKSGFGTGKGFASCSEMEFYVKNPENFDYSTLFSDQTCSDLKPGITEEEILKCEYPFFKNIAYHMLKGKYDREFRIDEFKAYPHPDIMARTHKTNAYSLLDNPTGISVKENETIIVFVGDTHGKTISLRVQNLDKPKGDGFGGTYYALNPGVNKLRMSTKGLVYVMYHTSTIEEADNAQPIKIHFASGSVNGYFDSNKHQPSDWKRLLDKAVDPYFDLVGKYAHLTFPTYRFRTLTPDGKALIDAYDLLVNSEMEFMGLYRYDKVFRNRMYFNVMYHSYMYATWYHTAYHDDTLQQLCDVNKFKAAPWGPAHEVGHCNQTRPGFKWLGTTEVTNNVMSLYIQTSVFDRPSRLQTENMGNGIRNRYSKAWTSLVAPRPQLSYSSFGDNDVFCKLVPLWQLELYFGKVLGRTPLQQSDKGGFYPDVYEHVRTHSDLPTAGEQQLEFVYIASLKAQKNLIGFFKKWGFLTPVDVEIDDYGKGQMKITQSQVDNIIKRVNDLGFPEPDVALEYITDNTVEVYKTKADIIPGTATRSGQVLTMTNWKNVVAYEVVNEEEGKMVCISDGVLEASSIATFDVRTPWQSSFKVYAVSATGKRVEVVL
ncbi:M60 family metallopeptidase [Bacteroides pyogenes]|uniref:M60 family metallopeptidase n=1 Tax=Bacteroides pyogenes TaxID=310300 RepID=UPI00374D3DBC